MAERTLTLEQVRKAGRIAMWRNGLATWRPPDRLHIVGPLTIGTDLLVSDVFADDWHHVRDCDCEFCGGV